MAVRTWRNSKHLYTFVGGKCGGCNSIFFPKRAVCSTCGGTDFSEHPLSGSGTVATFTVIRTATANEKIDIPARTAPYILAIIQLAEGPRVTAEVVDCEADEVAIGSPVEPVFRKIAEKGEKGVIQYGYKFRLASKR